MKDRLAIDGDGVIFDYQAAFPRVWKKAFGTELKLVEPNAFYGWRAYGVVWDGPAQQLRFEQHFEAEDWAELPLMAGADEACALLDRAG